MGRKIAQRSVAQSLIAAGLFFALTACSPPAQETTPAKTETPAEAMDSGLGEMPEGEPSTPLAVEADDARLGNPDALVTVVSFLDFQCGFCARGFDTLLELRKKYKDDELRIVFKHLPLDSHDQAFPAAVVGQAVTLSAGSEAFFKFAEEVFHHQSRIDYQTLAEWSSKVGVDRKRYNELVGQEQTARRVIQDVVVARRLGVDSTPTFFVNGRLIPGAQERAFFEQMIDEELAYMKSTGKPWRESYQARVTENMSGSIVEALLAQDPHDYRVPLDGSPVTGPASAPVTLVTFSDYECPFCKRGEETVDALRAKYGADLRVVFKHLPLPFHEFARPAALLAASVQKHKGDAAFFAITSDLFRLNPELSTTALRSLGKKHGLTEPQVEQALDGSAPELSARIGRDLDLADDVLARGTPHFFINGKRMSGARPIEQFEALINFERDRALSLIKSGVAPGDVYQVLQKDAEAPGAPEKVSGPVASDGRPSRGAKDAPVTVHIFSDFECPYCRRGEETLAELESLYPEQLRVVWHDFPLPFHEQALPAARAARYAFVEKGSAGFWKMHAALFALDKAGSEVSREQILAHGKDLGLDAAKLGAAMDSEANDASIQADMKLAESLGIDGTPAFVIGEYLITGARPLRTLQRVVDLSLRPNDIQNQPAAP